MNRYVWFFVVATLAFGWQKFGVTTRVRNRYWNWVNSDRLVIEFKTEEDLLRQLKAIKVYKEIELHKLGPSVKDTGIRCSDKAAVRAYMKQADARAAEINGELRRILHLPRQPSP